MLNLIKYALEGLAVAMATSIISRGKMSFGETLLMALSAMAVFLVLDVFAPLTASGARHGAGFGVGLNMVGVAAPVPVPPQAGGSDPDMCGGGLVEALQYAGAVEETVKSEPAFSLPYKFVKGQYGTSLQAGFNEKAEGYNAESLDNLASY